MYWYCFHLKITQTCPHSDAAHCHIINLRNKPADSQKSIDWTVLPLTLSELRPVPVSDLSEPEDIVWCVGCWLSVTASWSWLTRPAFWPPKTSRRQPSPGGSCEEPKPPQITNDASSELTSLHPASPLSKQTNEPSPGSAGYKSRSCLAEDTERSSHRRPEGIM